MDDNERQSPWGMEQQHWNESLPLDECMTDNAKVSGADEARLQRIEALAVLFDSRFKIPFTSIRFGWDGLVGLVPGVGDAATLLPQLFILYQAYRMKVGKKVLAAITLNIVLDLVAGGIPIVGDIFDVTFKSNRKNAKLVADAINRRVQKDVIDQKRVNDYSELSE